MKRNTDRSIVACPHGRPPRMNFRFGVGIIVPRWLKAP